MSLLSGLIVQGLRQGSSRAVSQALGQAVGSQLGSGFYTSLRPGGGASSSQQQASVDRAQQQLGGNTVAPVDVAGAVPAPPPSALAQVLGGAGSDALVGNAAADTLAGVDVEGQQQQPNASALAQALTTPTVAPLDVVGPARTPMPTAEPQAPLISGPVPLTTMGQPDIQMPNLMEPTDESGDQSITAEQVAMMAPFAALGLMPNGANGGQITPAGEGGMNLPIKDLIAGGLLAGGLVSGTGGLGSAGDGLKGIAENSKNLANRLGDVAAAGMEGNIGGKGMNAIRRMVRKAQAAIRQRYSGMGMSGSTAEQDDLNDAAEAGVEQQFKIGQQMAQTGLNAIAGLTNQSASAYMALLNASTAKDTALGNALANFAGAIAR